MTTDRWSGGCLCGAIRYEIDPANIRSWYCHCRMCQKWTGSVVAPSVLVPRANFCLTRGDVRYFRSSAIAERGFCASCGSPLLFAPFGQDWLCVQTGTLDDPELAPPTGHFGIEGHVSWLPIDDSLKKVRTEDDPWIREMTGGTGKGRG